MKSFHFLLLKSIPALCIILLQGIFGKFDQKTNENIVEYYRFQEQLISCKIMIEIEGLSIFEEIEEEEDQCFFTYKLFQKTTTNTYNSSNFPLMEKHIQNVILFESDNSPPFIIKS